VATCPICDNTFDESVYQLIVPGLGVFDSIACVEEARRRHRHHARAELMDGLIVEVERRVREEGGGAPSEEAPPVAND
jgi:hypothetical protein